MTCQKVAVLGCAVVFGLLAMGCSGAVEPRWAERSSETTLATDEAVFESPRQTTRVEASPDIGQLIFDGIVQAAETAPVVAPSDGRVIANAASTGDRVDVGDPVLTFLPATDRASGLQRDILELELEIAVELGNASAEAQSALDAFDLAVAETAFTISAPEAGIVLGVRDGLTRSAVEGGELFSIATSDDVSIVVVTSTLATQGLEVGDSVAVRAQELGAATSDATIASIESDDGRVRMEVRSDQPLGVVDLRSVFDVEVDLRSNDGAVENTWVSREAVHRRAGDSFLLTELEDGRLRRLDVRFGRRTGTHVEVLELTGLGSVEPGLLLVLA